MRCAMNKWLSISFFLLVALAAQGQHRAVTWSLLAKVTWDDRYFPKYDESVWYPDFSKDILALDNTLIEIKGCLLYTSPSPRD